MSNPDRQPKSEAPQWIREAAKRIEHNQQEYDRASFPLKRHMVVELIREEYENGSREARLERILRLIVESARNGNEPGNTWMSVAGGLINEAEELLK